MSSSRRSASDVNILATLDGLGARSHAKRTALSYGAAGVLACVLLGTLAWLAHDAAPGAGQPTIAVAAVPAEAPAAPAADAAKVAQAAPTAGAVLVDVPSPAADLGPTPAAMPSAAAAPALAFAPLQKRASAPKTLAANASPIRPGAGRVHPAAHPSKRFASASRPTAPPAAVDTDVALITAIIQHAAKERAAAGDADCSDKPCGPRMPPRP